MNQMIRSFGTTLLICLLSALLPACTMQAVNNLSGEPNSIAQADSAISPKKSSNDEYVYRYFILENGLEVLLVSDPEATKAAAALNVNVGSGDNPEGRGGLAHFLEHMLFLGTDKYPDAGEYGRYISEHGGSQNAYTNFEHTNYFFDVDETYLPGALDRFAQFFIAPRFDTEYVDREKNAVQAEYLQSLKSDGRRNLDVMQQVMNPEHPYSQIAVGTLDTLADLEGSPVRTELIEFYQKWYSAEQMALVVFGAQSLDELEHLVRDKFAAVPSNSSVTDPGDRDSMAPMFLPEDLPMLVQVEPLGTRRLLQVSFPVMDYRPNYDVKPSAYVGNLVGHEGRGSLLSQLKAEGLAEGLSAGTGMSSSEGALFSVTISLTEKGSDNYTRILELLFDYFEMLREQGSQQRLYDESARLADLQFRFLQHGNAMGYVTSLATALHYYAPDDILYGPYMMVRFDEEMIEELVASLKPANAIVVLTKPGVKTSLLSPYYEVEYSVNREIDIDGVHMGTVATSENPGTRSAGETSPAPPFTLPEPNAFIPDDVSLVDNSSEHTEKPSLLLEQNRQEIWFGQDEEFRIPKGGIYVNFRSPLVTKNPQETARASMYVSLLKDELNELTYPALLAGLNFSFYAQPWGISMRISGYNDKQQVLMGELLGPMAQPAFDQQRFADIRDRAVRGLQNRPTSRPSSQVMARLNEALLHRQWSDEDLIAAYEAMELDDVKKFVNQFWAEAEAEVLVYGNYAPDVTEELAGLLDRLVGSPLLPTGDNAASHAGNRVVKIPSSTDLLLPMQIQHDDSVVAWYMQAPGITWNDRATTALTAQVMKPEFFQQLRTEQQLGYTVSAFGFRKFKVPGLVMLVQSPVASAPEVTQAMDAFMTDLASDVDIEQFNRHKDALIVEIDEPDKNLWERAEYYWQSMADGHYEFDSRENLLSSTRRISFEEWQNYFHRVFLRKSHSLKIVAPGKQGLLPDSRQQFESAKELKQAFDFYEFR